MEIHPYCGINKEAMHQEKCLFKMFDLSNFVNIV